MSKTSDRRTLFGVAWLAWLLVILIVAASTIAGYRLAVANRDRDAARAETGAVAGQSQELVECVKGPQIDCRAEAAQVEKTIDDVAAGSPGPTGAQGSQGSTGVQGIQGPTGPQGPRGLMGQVGPRGIPGDNGEDGPPGPVGAVGPPGQQGATGDIGPAGPAGSAGADGQPGSPGRDGTDGAPGRGIETVDCDPVTEQFVVTYTDSTTQLVEGSDCVAGDALITP